MRQDLKDSRVVVYGLGKSGLSAVRLLLREGAQVTALDQARPSQLGKAAFWLREQGVTVHPPSEAQAVLQGADLVVVSPGVPLALPELQAAQAAGVELWGEVELAYRLLPQAPLFGITGTNGKSTTTALLGALFEAAGRRAFVGGNLGQPLCEAALCEEGFQAYVVELSSYQLEGIGTLRCRGAAMLNLTPDHLERYPSFAAYGQAKARIFRNQQQGDFAVLNGDDPAVRGVGTCGGAQVHSFTLQSAGGGRAGAGLLALPEEGGFTIGEERYTVGNRALRGAHNLQNAMAATLLARGGGLAQADVQRGLDLFPGLPHRLETVATVRGVEWVNDSKATNVDSSVVALSAFEGGVWLILGGKGKGSPYLPLVEASEGKVRGVYAIGEDAKAVAAAFEGALPVQQCDTLEAAVQQAAGQALAGEVVLLSPACASYDQFSSFEHRGEVFRALVKGL